MFSERGSQRRGIIGLLLLFIELCQFGFDRIPPVTLGTIAFNVAVFLGVVHPFFNRSYPHALDICVGVNQVWNKGDYWRILEATFYHAYDLHLYFNMVSFLWKGRTLEKRIGSGKFLYMLAIFSVLVNTVLLYLNYAAAILLQDPSYLTQCAVGFSGVVFAVKVVTTQMLPPGRTLVMGFIPVNTRLSCWLELLLIQILVPNASFTGHLSGILVGLAFTKTPLQSILDWPFSGCLHDEATNPNRSNVERDGGISQQVGSAQRDEEEISQNLDSYCEELKEFLVNKAKSCGGVDRVFCVDRPVTIAPLQISQKTKEYLSDEMGHYHHRSEISEILNEPPKSDVSVEELFVKANEHAEELASKKQLFTKESRLKYIDANGNIVCVLGQAGMGKTTLTKVLLNRIVSEEKLYDADFIFYLQFRDLVYGDKTDILSFLAKDFSATWMEKKSIRNAVLNRLAESKVCIIMDGFDEANLDSDVESKPPLNHNDEATAEAFIWNLFRGNIFPKAKKLITSRPRQLLKLPEELRPQFVVNILGLDTKAQKKICKDICDTNDEIVFNYTQDHPDISSHCFVPVNCILVMHCINELSQVGKSNCRMPTTLTGIIVAVLCLFIDSPQVRKHFKFKMESLRVLAELAWNGFMRNKYYFNESDLEKAGFEKEQLDTFFITILGNNKLSVFNGLSPNHTYFSHLLWQEFFVAIKLMFFVTPDYFRTTFFDKTETKGLSSDQSEQMKFDFTDSRFEMVAKFVFGLCNVTTYEYLHEKFPDIPEFPSSRAKLLKHMTSQKFAQDLHYFTSGLNFPAFLQTCTWVNEMHDEVFTKVISEKVRDDLTVVVGEILPSDVAGFHYILRAISQPISVNFGPLNGETKAGLLANRCTFYFRGDSLIRFFKEMHKTIQSSSVSIRINLECNAVGDEAMRQIANCISKIDELQLDDPKITEVLISKIQQLTKPMERLAILYLKDKEAHLLSTCISKIRRLDLYGCAVTSEGVKAMTSQIQLLKEPMKGLNLERNPIGDEGAYHLSTCINKIEDLGLHGCEITSKGVQHLASKIQHLTKPMKRLDISEVKIGEDGFIAISSCIDKLEKLHIGNEWDHTVPMAGIEALAAAVQNRREPMEELDVCCDHVFAKEARDKLKCCRSKVKKIKVNRETIW